MKRQEKTKEKPNLKAKRQTIEQAILAGLALLIILAAYVIEAL